MSIGLKELQEKYNKGSNYFRTLLCRPEFNQFRIDNNQKFFVMDDSNNFHKMLKHVIGIKSKKYIILLFLLFSANTAFCQHYEPVIIYNQYGEPQSMLKAKIIYNNYGLPKKIHHMDDGQNKN